MKRKSPAQKKAFDAYLRAEAETERYLGSVFVTPQGQRDKEAKEHAAYLECKRLGMGVEHGL
jgi:hypothetical protein